MDEKADIRRTSRFKAGASPQLYEFVTGALGSQFVRLAFRFLMLSVVGRFINIAPFFRWMICTYLISSTIDSTQEWISVFLTPTDHIIDTVALTAIAYILHITRLVFLYLCVAAYLGQYNLTVSDLPRLIQNRMKS